MASEVLAHDVALRREEERLIYANTKEKYVKFILEISNTVCLGLHYRIR